MRGQKSFAYLAVPNSLWHFSSYPHPPDQWRTAIFNQISTLFSPNLLKNILATQTRVLWIPSFSNFLLTLNQFSEQRLRQLCIHINHYSLLNTYPKNILSLNNWPTFTFSGAVIFFPHTQDNSFAFPATLLLG